MVRGDDRSLGKQSRDARRPNHRLRPTLLQELVLDADAEPTAEQKNQQTRGEQKPRRQSLDKRTARNGRVSRNDGIVATAMYIKPFHLVAR
jgi:hypothetical protein